MIRKILFGLAVLIGLCSITLNVLFFTQLNEVLKTLKHSGNRLVLVSRFFGFRDGNVANDSLHIRLNSTEKEAQFLELIDSTLYKLLILQDELVSTSGGRNPETGDLINPGSTYYANSYFFSQNNFRSYGIEYFDEIMSNYLNTVKKLNYPSHILSSVNRYNNYNGGTLFDNMTVAESMNFIELLKANIIIDKYVFLSSSQGNRQ